MAGAFASGRPVTVAGILAIVVLSWWYLVDMDMMAMMVVGHWTSADWIAMFLMWAIMMLAMMLPSALPMILMYQVIAPRRSPQLNPYLATWGFTVGYAVAWTLFSVAATGMQWWLQSAKLLSPMLEPHSYALSAAILLVAGLYQWLPLKDTCLARCRAPVEFLTANWRGGLTGGFILGLHHGLYCLGCCWMLMLLLFAGGVMNLLLVAVIAVFVLAEKVLPYRWPVSKLAGLVLIIGAFCLLYRAELW